MERDARLDGLKFILIFLVVLGHMSFKDYGIHVHRMIYAFHMPTFVFLSGYFTPTTKTTKQQAAWIKKMVIILILAQFLHICLSLALGLPFQYSWLYSPAFTLWYLICLLVWRILIWRCFRTHSDGLLLVTSAALFIAAGFVPIDEVFSFQRIFSFFPFFVCGLLFRKYNALQTLEHFPLFVAVLVFITGLVLAREWPGNMPKYHLSSGKDLLIRLVQTALGGVLCLCIMRFSRLPAIGRLGFLGKYTLWIYIGHSFLTRINPFEKLLQHFCGIESNLFFALLICTLYCLFLGAIGKRFSRYSA